MLLLKANFVLFIQMYNKQILKIRQGVTPVGSATCLIWQFYPKCLSWPNPKGICVSDFNQLPFICQANVLNTNYGATSWKITY